jgi:hypothetical protein
MRSDLVFRANDKVQNRFQLCRLTSTSARTMVRPSVGMHITINQALEAISGHSAPIVVEPPSAAEPVPVDEVSPGFLLDPAV